MKTKIAISILIAGTVLFIMFTQLGGLDNVELTVERMDDTHIVGTAFNGKYNDYHLEDIYFEIKERLDDGTLDGEMAVVNYRLGGDSAKQGWIRQFVGIKLNSKNEDIDELEMVTLPAGKIIRAKVGAHNLVMPKPDEIEEMVQQKAAEQNAVVRSYTLERYVSDRELIIDTPINN